MVFLWSWQTFFIIHSHVCPRLGLSIHPELRRRTSEDTSLLSRDTKPLVPFWIWRGVRSGDEFSISMLEMKKPFSTLIFKATEINWILFRSEMEELHQHGQRSSHEGKESCIPVPLSKAFKNIFYLKQPVEQGQNQPGSKGWNGKPFYFALFFYFAIGTL